MADLADLTKEFFANQTKLKQYHDAVRTLREIGLEDILRRIAEPNLFTTFDNPLLQQILSHDHAKKQGWYDALYAIFNFQDFVVNETKTTDEPDFGATELLRQTTGATEKELADL